MGIGGHPRKDYTVLPVNHSLNLSWLTLPALKHAEERTVQCEEDPSQLIWRVSEDREETGFFFDET